MVVPAPCLPGQTLLHMALEENNLNTASIHPIRTRLSYYPENNGQMFQFADEHSRRTNLLSWPENKCKPHFPDFYLES